MNDRRKFLQTSAALAGASVAAPAFSAQTGRDTTRWDSSYSGGAIDTPPMSPGLAGKDYRPVIVPDGNTLPWNIVNGVKIYHLVAEERTHEFAPGLKATCWGYSGNVNSTVIEAVEGDRVRIYVTNKLNVPTTVHWHGIYLPNGMDGVSGVTQKPIRSGETFKYEFTLRQSGTFMYHSHHDTMTQEGMGLIGMLIVHPRQPTPDDQVDRDFVLMLSEWRIDPGSTRPNPNEMTDFNVLTINGKCFPGTSPLVIKRGERVRIRFGNLSAMDHHPIHLHGYRFKVTATDGEKIPQSAQWPETTVLVSVGQTRDIEFVADAAGDWIMHCHMTHHVMNQMGHDIPNSVGVVAGSFDSRTRALLPDYMTMGQGGMGERGTMGMAIPKNSIPMVGAKGPFSYIGMGGMFTILKVRQGLASYEDPGWYKHPAGTVADTAAPEDMVRDGIKS